MVDDSIERACQRGLEICNKGGREGGGGNVMATGVGGPRAFYGTPHDVIDGHLVQITSALSHLVTNEQK